MEGIICQQQTNGQINDRGVEGNKDAEASCCPTDLQPTGD